MHCVIVDARTSSAAFNRQQGGSNQNSTGTRIAPRKRKVTQSAGPSLAALRQALLISGGTPINCILHSVVVLQTSSYFLKQKIAFLSSFLS